MFVIVLSIDWHWDTLRFNAMPARQNFSSVESANLSGCFYYSPTTHWPSIIIVIVGHRHAAARRRRASVRPPSAIASEICFPPHISRQKIHALQRSCDVTRSQVEPQRSRVTSVLRAQCARMSECFGREILAGSKIVAKDARQPRFNFRWRAIWRRKWGKNRQ